METRTELKTFLINHQCPQCKNGNMQSIQGVTLTSNPPQYAHKCNNQDCGYEALLTKQYPFTTHDFVQPKQPKAKPIPKQSNLASK